MIVDGRVDVPIADSARSVPALFLTPAGGPAPSTHPFRDLAQLLDVDVDELTGPLTLIATDDPFRLAGPSRRAD